MIIDILLFQDGKCEFHKSEVVADLSACKDVDSESESDLMSAVGSQGPVSVAIDASHSSFQMYSGGWCLHSFVIYLSNFKTELKILDEKHNFHCVLVHT